MNSELSLALWMILIVSITAAVYSPMLCWLLPNRTGRV